MPTATAFLVNINNVFHLVTAKHVVYNNKTGLISDDEMYMFFNTMDGAIMARSICDIKKMLKIDWIFHEDSNVDVAIIPFGLDENDDVLFIPDNTFLSADQLYEVHDIFFLSYQPGIKIAKKITPIIRSGTISLMNEDNTFL